MSFEIGNYLYKRNVATSLRNITSMIEKYLFSIMRVCGKKIYHGSVHIVKPFTLHFKKI
jgi:hypothetical protein